MAENLTTQRRKKQGTRNTIAVALLVSLFCSVMVSGTAIFLKPRQVENRLFFGGQQTVIRLIETLYPVDTVNNLLRGMEIRFVDLTNGNYVEGFDPETFDQRELVNDPEQSTSVPQELDIAGIVRRENAAMVYLLRQAGSIETIILPVHGRGMWSTIYAYVALSADAESIAGLIIQEHGETPGIGDKIEEPAWLSSWQGKQIYEDGIPVIEISGQSTRVDESFQVDVLVGATRTNRAVVNMINYWLGEHGFQNYLVKLKLEAAGEA